MLHVDAQFHAFFRSYITCMDMEIKFLAVAMPVQHPENKPLSAKSGCLRPPRRRKRR